VHSLEYVRTQACSQLSEMFQTRGMYKWCWLDQTLYNDGGRKTKATSKKYIVEQCSRIHRILVCDERYRTSI